MGVNTSCQSNRNSTRSISSNNVNNIHSSPSNNGSNQTKILTNGKSKEKSCESLDGFTLLSNKSKGRVSSFFSTSASSKTKGGTIQTIAVTGSQIMMSSQKIDCTNLEKFAKHLVNVSKSSLVPTTPIQIAEISKIVFKKEVVPHSPMASEYLWNFFANYNENSPSITESQFTHLAEKIYAQITDKEQIQLYVKIFAKGKHSIDQAQFHDFLFSAYQLDIFAQNIGTMTSTSQLTGNDLVTDFEQVDGNEWIQAVIKSCFHLKDDMSVYFVCNWLELNLPRLLITTHKYITHQLTTGYAHAQSIGSPNLLESVESTTTTTTTDLKSPQMSTSHNEIFMDKRRVSELSIGRNDEEPITSIRNQLSVTGINPVLLWLMRVSLPVLFVGPLQKKPVPLLCPFTKFISPQQLLRQLLNQDEGSEPWTLLYDSSEQGTSINRFQYNIHNYKGPTVMLIFADNGYTLCIGSDEEWKESSKFWGQEDSFLCQLQPEFRIVERGPKLLYTNFSIRGYPFGIQVGKDTKNVSVEIKPDFQYVSFKGIPGRINKILVYGCGSKQIKTCQTEYKKWEDKQCELQRVVKLSKSDWNENPDKYLLELGGVTRSYAHGNN